MYLKVKNLKMPGIAPIDFELEKTGLYGLIGKNGIGKSTFYSILSGEISVKQGDIQVGRVSYLSAIEYFDENLSGWDYLKLLDEAEYQKSLQMASFFGADSYLARKIGKYSFGMKQLFATILAFSTPSDILIIDELFNGLDVLAKSKVFQELQKCAQEKIILYTSHNLKEIEHFCDITYLLSETGISRVADFAQAAKEIGYIETFF
ncbi:AAA family ATPase [Lactovum odontotermitis]